MEKILFLEDKDYYKRLGVLKENSKYIYEFDGIKKYKISKENLTKYYAVVSVLYNNPVSNFIIIKAKKVGVKTILLSDGIYDFSNAYKNTMQKKKNVKLFDPILHDVFLCVGKKESAFFKNRGVEVMTFLPKRVLNSSVDKIELLKENMLLITTANTAYFDDIERDQLLNLLEKVIKKLEEKNVSYIFRIFDDYLIKKLRISEKNNFKEGKFEDVLSLVTGVITTPSSIALTSMYHGRSTGQLIYRDSPLFLQTGWNISGNFPIEISIDSMLKMEKERIEFQETVLMDYITEKDCSEIFEESLEIGRKNKLELFININLQNMLDSNFNLNLEYIIRKLYLKVKKNNLIKRLRHKVK